MNESEDLHSPHRQQSAQIGEYTSLKDLGPKDLRNHPLYKSQKAKRETDEP